MDGSIDDNQLLHGTLTLVVGDMEDWLDNGRVPPEIGGFHFADVSDIAATFIRRLNPGVILSPLVARQFDALDIARKLGNMDFKGSYRVLTDNVPDTSLIIQEVSNIAPNLDFDVISLKDLYIKH